MTRHSSLQVAAVVVVVVVAVDLRVSSVWDPDMAFAPAPREGSRVAGLWPGWAEEAERQMGSHGSAPLPGRHWMDAG